LNVEILSRMSFSGYVLFLPGSPVKRCRHSEHWNTCKVCRRFLRLPFLVVCLQPHSGQTGFCCVVVVGMPETEKVGDEKWVIGE